jgi:hypothetical protein
MYRNGWYQAKAVHRQRPVQQAQASCGLKDSRCDARVAPLARQTLTQMAKCLITIAESLRFTEPKLGIKLMVPPNFRE